VSDIATYRMEAYEKRADAADVRMRHVEELLTDIRLEMGNIRGDLRNVPSKGALWGMIGTTVAIAVGLVGIFVSVLTYLQAFHLPH
jgi:hypothetical protein